MNAQRAEKSRKETETDDEEAAAAAPRQWKLTESDDDSADAAPRLQLRAGGAEQGAGRRGGGRGGQALDSSRASSPASTLCGHSRSASPGARGGDDGGVGAIEYVLTEDDDGSRAT